MAEISSISTIQGVFSATPEGPGQGNSSTSTASSSVSSERPASQPQNAPGQNKPDSNRTISNEELQEGAELLDSMASALRKEISFEVIEDQDIVQARITNADTGEVIRKIPSDEVIVVKKKIDAFLGLFVDEFR